MKRREINSPPPAPIVLPSELWIVIFGSGGMSRYEREERGEEREREREREKERERGERERESE